MKKILFYSVLLLLAILFFSARDSFFFILNPEERAARYMSRAFDEYREAIRNNPGEKDLLNEYAAVLAAKKGEINAKVEIALFFKEIGMEKEGENLLLEVVLKDRKKTVEYLEQLVSEAGSPQERISIYTTALKISPGHGVFWYQLGRLYLGMNMQEEGIEALEKAYSLNIREDRLFYYLGQSLMQRGDYKKAEFYIDRGLKENESLELRRLRYALYSKQKKQDFAARERERISQLLAKLKVVGETGAPGTEIPEGKPSPGEPAAGVPEIIPGITPYKFLYASKKKQELMVYNVDSTGLKVLDSVPVTTGKNSGPKKNRGDEKTPHGAYLITSRIDGSTLPAKYGIMAYPLSYPNPIDRRLKRDGDGIWLHGTPIERPPYHSEGCLVVNDMDMKKLMEHITVRRTFVSINKEMHQLTPALLKEVLDSLNQWARGWESLDIENYMASYDEAFYSGGRDKNQFRAYKKRVNANKTFIRVGLSDIQVIPYGDSPLGELVLAFFRQKYDSNNFSSRSYKMVYMVNRKDGWKIIGEENL